MKRRRPPAPRIVAGLFTAVIATASLSTAHADKPAAAPPAPSVAQTVSVTAKLVEIPGTFPPDDLYDYAYVMRYEVIGGPMDKQTILVAHYKPRQPRAKIKDQMKAHVAGKLRSFKQGDVHKLELSAELKRIWQGALVDEFAATDRKSIRYWALVADPT
jgi:hypothetical protein